jgi:hypothetical protein
VTPLLFYLGSALDPQRFAVGPALAAAAERAGWGFECYYGAPRRGRHFGGGDPERADAGVPNGSLVAGGRHLEQAFRLATRRRVAVLGDSECVLWPALEEAGAELLLRSADPTELYGAALDRLGQPTPTILLVVDGAAQGADDIVVAPFLYPEFLDGPPALGLDVSAPRATLSTLVSLCAAETRALHVRPERVRELGLEDRAETLGAQTYTTLTADLADRHRAWGRGVLLGDPNLIAAQLPKARRLRLLPLYGRPQRDVIRAAADVFASAAEPIYGRQYDDRDFVELGKLGVGFQLLDPDPPFDAEAGDGAARLLLHATDEPDDEQLARWADERRILVTLLFWSGMVRELDCWPRLLDVVAATGARGGLVLTTPALEHGGFLLAPLGAPPSQGGVGGLVEVLLGSTGTGVCAENVMPDGRLLSSLQGARKRAEDLLGGATVRGWWPLLDAPLRAGSRRPVGRRGRRPVALFTPRFAAGGVDSSKQPRRDLRALARSTVEATGLGSLFDQRRPFESHRPGELAESVADAVRASGFSYMWTKSGFGTPRVVYREGEFVALSLTAGRWEGWSPFYTLASMGDLRRPEKRLLRARRPGWLVGTIDAPLWALSGEILERGRELVQIARFAAEGGRSGELVNVTPNVVSRYARLLDDRGLLA